MNKLKKLIVCAVTLCATVSAFGLDDDYGRYWKDHGESQQAQKWFEGQVRKCLKPGKNPGQCLDKLFKGVSRCKNLYSVKDNQIPAWCWFNTSDYRASDNPKGKVRLESASQPGYYKDLTEYIPSVYVTKAFGEVAKSYFALEGNPKYLDYKKMDDFYKKNKNTWAAPYLMVDWALHNDDVRCYALSVFVVKTLIPSASAEERKGRIAGVLKDTAWEVSVEDGIHQWWSQAVNVYHDKDTFYKVKWEIFSNIFFYDTIGAKPLRNFRRFWDNFAIAPVYKDPKIRAQQAKKIRDVLHKDYKWCQAESYYPADLLGAAIKYGYWYSPKELANQKKIQEDNKRREVGFGISSHLRK